MADQQIQTSPSTVRPDNQFNGFNQLAEGLSVALTDFQKLQNAGTFDTIWNALKPSIQVGRRALGFTADYSRRHPARIAIGLAVIGLLAATIMKYSTAEKSTELH